MTDEEAIGILGYQLNMKDTDIYTPINYQAIETALNLIEKKDKIISLMAERLTTPINSKEWVIDFIRGR